MKQNPFLPAEDPLYPSSDGLPLAENDWQLEAILDAVGVLKIRYGSRPDVYVSGDLLIYYEEGNPRKSVAPDVFVVFGATNHRRNVYKLWEEPKAPDFVLEVASENTWKEDLGRKRALYAELGVREYWLFDPKDEYFDPPLQGLVLREGAYRALPALVDGGARTIRSDVLGLDLRADRGMLRFRDPATGECLRSHAEEWAARSELAKALAEERLARDEATAALRFAEARIAELEARLR
ncbi:MAG: Uma2 family endonuclease [Gammaproteobacteria bacterium]|nr:Uma2 family endonuclease [Gammaproteobacteria bacterium]